MKNILHIVPKAGNYILYTAKDVQHISVLKNIDEDDIPIVLDLEEDTYLNEVLVQKCYNINQIYDYIIETVSKIPYNTIIEYINELEIRLPYSKEFDKNEELYKSNGYYTIDFDSEGNKDIVMKVPINKDGDLKYLDSIAYLVNHYDHYIHVGNKSVSLLCPKCFKKVQKGNNYISIETYDSKKYIGVDSFLYDKIKGIKKCPHCQFENRISKFITIDDPMIELIQYINNISDTKSEFCCSGHSWSDNGIYISFKTENKILESALFIFIIGPTYSDLDLEYYANTDTYRIGIKDNYTDYLAKFNNFTEYQNYFINKIFKLFKQCMNDNT